MRPNVKLSVIVPIYKVEKYIEQCLKSLIEQTEQAMEIILVDDGSPDKCPQICDDYKKKDSRITVIHKLNGGLVSARKAGVKAAKGKYIGFVDGDDWVENDFFKKMLSKAEQHNADVVVSDFYSDYPNKRVKCISNLQVGFYDKDKMKNEIFPQLIYNGKMFEFGVVPAIWNKLFKKELIEQYIYEVDNKIKMGEDAACTYPCILHANSCYIMEHTPMYHYRQNNSSMTKTHDPLYYERINVLMDHLEKSCLDVNNMMTHQLDAYRVFLLIKVVSNESRAQYGRLEKIRNIKRVFSEQKNINAFECITLSESSLEYKICIALVRKRLFPLLLCIIDLRRMIK